jgi:hypothetical protein
MSAPSVSGSWLTGVPNVLSTQTIDPQVSLACFAKRSISMIFSVGLVGVSKYNNAVGSFATCDNIR